MDQCYQFKVLCFGSTSAQRIFTKIVSVVAAYLRTLGIRLAVYLDDWLIVNQNKRQLLSILCAEVDPKQRTLN
jgi:hypothetical protein